MLTWGTLIIIPCGIRGKRTTLNVEPERKWDEEEVKEKFSAFIQSLKLALKST
jgi:hypothetical protein